LLADGLTPAFQFADYIHATCTTNDKVCRTAFAACRQLLGLLRPAFMQLQQTLLLQLDEAIMLLQQRPDSLAAFTAWLEAAAVHFLPGVAAAAAGSKLQQDPGVSKAPAQRVAHGLLRILRFCVYCMLALAETR
jgi:hypothetical protein